MEKLGATGEFPKGKMHPEDEGQIKLGVTVRGNKVLLMFGKPITWLGMDPEDARKIALALMECAAQVEKPALPVIRMAKPLMRDDVEVGPVCEMRGPTLSREITSEEMEEIKNNPIDWSKEES